jgi:hypothetical protein
VFSKLKLGSGLGGQPLLEAKPATVGHWSKESTTPSISVSTGAGGGGGGVGATTSTGGGGVGATFLALHDVNNTAANKIANKLNGINLDTFLIILFFNGTHKFTIKTQQNKYYCATILWYFQ